jgi:methyl-accepting chemotaxis protein
MNDSLSGLIGKIRTVSHSIDARSEEVASASASLAHQVGEQTEFFRRTAASLRDLADAVSSNAESAGSARKLAADARSVAVKGGLEVGQAIETMTRISASSEKIVEIVSIIDGITFQTNILALNASVEAARAGEHGRGFAVVAAEVRSLAQRSADAAREITALIDQSVRELAQGGGIIEKAGATMTQIVTGSRAVDDIMSEIAAASAQQRQVIEQVRATVDSIDQTTEQQMLLTQAAQAAASMRQQAQDLTAAVSVFRLSTHAADAAAPASDVVARRR